MPDKMMLPEVAVLGAGPAGLMAAEVLATGGARVTLLDRMPSPARKLLIAGRGGLNLTHSEPLPAFLSRYGAARDAAGALHRGLPARRPDRLGRGAGPADLHRQLRPGLSQGDEGLAAAARLDRAARGARRQLAVAASLAGLGGWARWPSRRRKGRCSSARRRRCWRSAAPPGRGSARMAPGPDCWRACAAAPGQLRLPHRLVGAFPRPLRRRAAEAHRLVLRRRDGARRGGGDRGGHRGRRGLCPVRRPAGGDRAPAARRP